MRFISTRGLTEPVSFSEAVAVGLAPDGGLFLPRDLPDLRGELDRFAGLPYPELAFEFLRRFATDIPEAELRPLLAASYARFAGPEVAPLRRLGERLHVLELFHGPTLAFKDFALQVLGRLYARQCGVRRETINAFGATSGDTGAAAIHGLLDQPGTAIFILYPDGRISALQERQMACTGASNVFALAIDGTFDEGQSVLKEIFADQPFRIRHRLSAVNSINLARILAQCVYYLHAWLRLPPEQRPEAEFVVPTGNFGNVLAGWLLRRMGVPIAGFRIATNHNDILYRLFTTGLYEVHAVKPSLAPSMDIQAASNFERFLYYSLDSDAAGVREAMSGLSCSGRWAFPKFDRDVFTASRCDDGEISGIIRAVHREHGYVVDPHTACGFKDLDRRRASVVLATASPAKFPETIRAALGFELTHPALEALKTRPVAKHRLPAKVGPIKAFLDAHAV